MASKFGRQLTMTDSVELQNETLFPLISLLTRVNVLLEVYESVKVAAGSSTLSSLKHSGEEVR